MSDRDYKIEKGLDGQERHPAPRVAMSRKKAYKNTRLHCEDIFYGSCEYYRRPGTCALVRVNAAGMLVTHSIEERDPEFDVCHVSPPYVPLKAHIKIDAASMMGGGGAAGAMGGAMMGNNNPYMKKGK